MCLGKALSKEERLDERKKESKETTANNLQTMSLIKDII